ncbi:MAG: bifunctional glutathionylspermidine amidase/synthase [Bacteriovoracaceae bacterium]|nr:bifunctional glutathionylspermidine amidase/synthase [Bacteriovoracaceae bacterium]
MMSSFDPKERNQKASEKFGTLLGMAPGNVPIYSSDYSTVDEEELSSRHTYRSYVDDIFMGYKWQCVEFARRWLYINKGYIFNDVAMAYDIFNLDSVRVIADNTTLPLHSFSNGSKRHPEPGSLLIWEEGGEFEETGHVAIITEVFSDKIRIVEQNENHNIWPEGQNYSRELRAKIDSTGGYWIECTYHDVTLLGWVIQTGSSEHSYDSTPAKKELFNLIKKEVKIDGQANRPWLNIANADEAAYIESYGPEIKDRKGNPNQYFCISETAIKEVKHATNELHAMFMHATDYVLQNEDLLEKFCIPKPLWAKLHKSWNNRRNEMITGRFDFAMSQDGLKVYEYNADSASCYMECGKIQKKWSKHFGSNEGRCAGEKLHSRLIEAWKDSDVSGVLHILLDDDLEETYHALFMRSAIEEAGIECKIIKGMKGLHWGEAGEIVDNDGTPIRWVWKTWAWETALDQIREECSEDESDSVNSLLKNTKKHSSPRLVDTLLGDNVLVYEPFWTLIPSNKAILPILWSLYPLHPYLLNSSFILTEELRQSGYVSKPIVGRCGANIKVFGANESLLHKTEGQFEERDHIYQELFKLQKIDNDNIQMQSFTVSGFYGGAGIRIDPSMIVASGSDLPSLRVIADDNF